MAILIAILLLLVAPGIMVLIHLWQPRFALTWLIAIAAALGAWLIILVQQTEIPFLITLVEWNPQQFFQESPALLIDKVSWPFALAVTTLTLTALLSDLVGASTTQTSLESSDRISGEHINSTEKLSPKQFHTSDWWSWTVSLALAGFGLLAILSANLLTVLLAWSALDLVEIIIWLSQARNNVESNQVVISFSGRLAGIVGLLWAGIVAKSTGLSLSFDTLTPQIGSYLVIAAGLRLGVLPGNVTQIHELARRRGLSSLMRLTPAAASLVLLGRAFFGADPSLTPTILVIIGLAAVYGGLVWLNAVDERQGQSSWVLGMSALALGSAALGQPAAGSAWGLALLLPGGLLFLTGARHPRLLPLHIISLVSMFSLPFTPTWQGVRLYSPPTSPIMLLFIIAHALLLTGYLRHMLRMVPTLSGAERWLWFFYPIGLALPPGMYFWISWWSRPGAPGSWGAQPLWIESIPGLVSVALFVLFCWLFILGRRSLRAVWSVFRYTARPATHETPSYLDKLQDIFSLNWLYRLVWATYLTIRRLVSLISRVIEGQGGILWALLLLTLLLSLLIQAGIPIIPGRGS